MHNQDVPKIPAHRTVQVKFGAACFYAHSHVDNFCIATQPFAKSDEESDELAMAADKDISNGAVL